jgi:cob(I)alamin adenosyltransferase
LALTGADATPGLIEAADYVTEFRMIKHPYNNGTPARLGVEF